MSLSKYCVALMVLLAAGCASAPDEMTAAAGGEPVQTAAVATAGQPTDVNVEDVALDPGAVVVCRDMLQTGSNVVVTRCMSRDGWRRYERFKEREAQEIVRTLQGSAYR